MAEDFKGEEAQNMSAGREVLSELIAEKESLDQSYVHCVRLLDQEISRLQNGVTNDQDPNKKQTEKIFIPLEDQKKYNLVGRLLGPKGLTLKRIQAETQTKMSILGRGSMRDKGKEEELRNGTDPAYQHLKENLHIVIEATGPHSVAKLAAGVAEVRKMLIPAEPGAPDPVGSKYQDPGMGGYDAPPLQASPRGPPSGGRPPRGTRGKSPGGRGGRFGGSAVRGGRGSAPPPAGGNRTPSNVRDYHHQPPVGGPPAGVGYGEPTPPSHGGYSAPGPHYGHESYNEGDSYYGSFADNRGGDAGYDRRGGGAGNEWKAPRAGRRDYRPHPYNQQQPPAPYF